MISKIPGSAIVLPPFCTLELPLQIPPRCARPPLAKGGWGDFAAKRRCQCANVMHFGLVLSHFEFEGFRTVMPALRLRSGQAPAGIQGEQAAACGYSVWIPAFAGMTQHSSTPQNHHDSLLNQTA